MSGQTGESECRYFGIFVIDLSFSLWFGHVSRSSARAGDGIRLFVFDDLFPFLSSYFFFLFLSGGQNRVCRFRVSVVDGSGSDLLLIQNTRIPCSTLTVGYCSGGQYLRLR